MISTQGRCSVATEIKAGDVVRLKSGGLKMTVSHIGPTNAECIYIHPTTDEPTIVFCGPEALKVAEDEEPDRRKRGLL
jgi:Uncharacterized small protein (DUF2158)